MQDRPLIAFVGSVDKTREQELKLVNPDTAKQAAEELGRELAKANCRLLVYSSNPDFVEFFAVRGYIQSGAAKPNSIQVRYPLAIQQPAFPDQNANDKLIDWRPDRSVGWEHAFYRSVEDTDGMILIGGGRSTLIGGLVAMGHRIPLLALASFGGSATKVWEALSTERDLADQSDISCMASPKWTQESAAEGVKVLLRQRQRLKDEKQKRRFEELRKSANITRQAWIAAFLFIAALACVPLAWGTKMGYAELLWLLFFSPVLGGISGATIRSVFDWRQGSLPHSPQSAVTTIALGLIAGGVAGLLFISAQLTAIPTGGDAATIKALQESQASRLVPFTVGIGFIAGLTLDAVFRRLLKVDVIRTEGVAAGTKEES